MSSMIEETVLRGLQPKSAMARRQAEKMPSNSIRKDSLIDFSHLPGAGENAATVDEQRHSVRVSVLLQNQFPGELGRAVKRPGACERKILGDSARRISGYARL